MNDKPSTLADQLLALCKQHGLTNLNIDISVRQDGTHYFGSFAHAQGVCASASLARDTPHAAISEAIGSLKVKLGETLVDVPELEAA